MYELRLTNRFKKDVKRCAKRGFDMQLLDDALDILRDKGTLPQQYRPHKLVNNYAGMIEAHIRPDWLLVWQQEGDTLIINMMHTGTHSDLF